MTQHATRAHAKLSASGAHRWMVCTPSANLEDKIEDRASNFALEGTAAHELSEIYLQRKFDKISKYEFAKKHHDFTEHTSFYNQDMEKYVKSYVDFVYERFNEMDKPHKLVLLEDRLDFSRWVPGGFGTGDVLIVAEGAIEVIDLKYGKGVRVDAHKNTQMMLYALGALDAYDMIYDINTVRMTIVQPRLDHISEYGLSAEELYAWADHMVKPLAKKAHVGGGELVAGKHCRFCKVKPTCEAWDMYRRKSAKEDFDVLTN
ncbi:DUF2800 domain-containing protein [Shouchella lonarensis]|uniref:PD-(D/E)XK nuclease superfamily protein n=1 Tax=Shouchella lonarensis TaxID=1464122 RepID=A0A1G6HRJ4_9BACI|nr:DUF2800 domain-containing protein [Shouchella lonarensis]SDB96852.1 Protein of unknown function [Shouchella lonarensis]